MYTTLRVYWKKEEFTLNLPDSGLHIVRSGIPPRQWRWSCRIRLATAAMNWPPKQTRRLWENEAKDNNQSKALVSIPSNLYAELGIQPLGHRRLVAGLRGFDTFCRLNFSQWQIPIYCEYTYTNFSFISCFWKQKWKSQSNVFRRVALICCTC